MNEKISILKLIRSKGVGINLFHKLLNKFETASNFINNQHLYSTNKSIEIASEDSILEEIDKTEKYGAKIITYLDDIYPKQLRSIDTFPPVLTIKGNEELLKYNKIVAIVGSRNTSINNYNFTKKIANELGNYGYVIISGMARGVDSAAHIGSLKTKTIAVLGGGINQIYPKENESLYHNIVENNGLLITENAFDAPSRPEYFPLRNRIIAAISRGVVLVDAGLMSGSLHTAGQAIKFNRELMVFPGSPYDDRSSGSNKLLQQGANLVISTKDIIECLEYFDSNSSFNDRSVSYDLKGDNFIEDDVLFKCLEKDETEMLENILLSKIDTVPININLLINDLIDNYSINNINSTLASLELKELILIENNMISLKKF